MGACCAEPPKPQPEVETNLFQSKLTFLKTDMEIFKKFDEILKLDDHPAFFFTGEEKDFIPLVSYLKKRKKELVPLFVYPFLQQQGKNIFAFIDPSKGMQNKFINCLPDFYDLQFNMKESEKLQHFNSFDLKLNKILPLYDVLGYYQNQSGSIGIKFIGLEKKDKYPNANDIVLKRISDETSIKSLDELFKKASSEKLSFVLAVTATDGEIWIIFKKTSHSINYTCIDVSQEFFQNLFYQEDLTKMISNELKHNHANLCGAIEIFKKREIYMIFSTNPSQQHSQIFF